MLEDVSCSDCKLEIIEQKWTKILLKWLNTCVPNDLKHLNLDILTDIVNKYKEDISHDDLDRNMLNSEDVESFIRYKFPILRLRNLFEAKDYPKKLYIMTSMLLYYCCTNSRTGLVDADICNNLDEEEQIVVLKFCEALTEMEATINNVDNAIKVAICHQNEERNKRNTPTASDSSQQYTSLISDPQEIKRTPILQFKSSITVLPSVITEASISRSSFEEGSDSSEFKSSFGLLEKEVVMTSVSQDMEMEAQSVQKNDSEESEQLNAIKPTESNIMNRNLIIREPSNHSINHQRDCTCSKCSGQEPCCGDPGCTKELCDDTCDECRTSKKSKRLKWIFYSLICAIFFLVLIIVFATMPMWLPKNTQMFKIEQFSEEESPRYPDWAWQCRQNFCHKVFRPTTNISLYTSLSRCTLLCMGPQLWPHPIGYTYFSKTIIAIATNKLEYKFQSIPSDTVHQYLAEAFKLFIKDLVRLEKIDTKSDNRTQDLIIKKMIIQIDVESDPDPRLRVNTDEAYMLKVETNQNQVLIKVSGVSFCGVRHGFETLSQLILLDQSTGYLITLSNMIIKDAPSYKYRGLMIDTGRNYIPVVELMKTVDAMATCKLNTFHWRISDVTSFPLHLIKLPQFLESGPYERSMVYTKDDIKTIVNRAGIRGIRVLIEVAVPGPVGRPWSWSSSATCPKKNNNYTCDNYLCMRLSMQEGVFDILQTIYSEIIEMTNVDDIFHLSDSVFSMTNCYYLFDDREGFLDKALVSLKMANKGFLPKLPIIWYTSHLMRDFEAKTWDRLGVQINEWDPNPTESYLSKFRAIHSTKWDLSCEMRKQRCTKYRTWQQMYGWKSWRNVDVFTIEGGESILWTDFVDSSNLDYHLWPRAAAVAERLWSDVIANASANRYVYMRLDTHRISDVTSFPLHLIKLPQFLESGPYERSMVYTKDDIKTIVNRAGIRGIRVLIEVAVPGPVGRPWSWSSSATCPKKNNNYTCDNYLCMRLSMQEGVFDILQTIYSEIIEMTNVDDIFHLSDSVFSMTNCYYLFDDREGFLDKALVSLKMANKGFLPKLPIIWYTSHLMRDFEAKTWDRLGVQINEWDPNPTESYLSKFRAIHSTKWDLSCEMRKQRCTKYRTWQQMYGWKSWRNVDVFTIEGGESILWTDFVDSSNLDYHLWPRAAAVAERLWSDVIANASANRYVYMRLDTHRWRMLLRGVKVQPIWPAWCSFNPSSCLEKVH